MTQEVQSPETWRDRELRFEPQMSDAEALMWNLEKDPALNPSGATVTILDQPIDAEQFRRRMRWAVARVSRLRERVVPAVAKVAPPQWRPDPEFNFDYHVRHVALPAPGTRRQLLDLATLLYEDPYDRTRPLWQFVIIDGLEDGRGAIFWKMHHTITDGIGAVRLAEIYMELQREAPEPPDVDLAEVLAEAVDIDLTEADEGEHSSPIPPQVRSLSGSVGHLIRRQAGLTRRALGEAATWGADPVRPFEQAASLVDGTHDVFDELFGRNQTEAGGSPLWVERSRGRHLEVLSVDLDEMLGAARTLGGTLNDLLLTAVAHAAHSYHAEVGADLAWLNSSFVVSTRGDSAAGGNSFTPTRVQLPAGPMSFAERFVAIHDSLAARRESSGGSGETLAKLAMVASRLPTALVAKVARQQAATIDVATSNFRAAPFTVYMSGAQVLENYPIGPVAGTACNLTALSYDGKLYMGVFSDPAAIADPERWRAHLEAAFDDVGAH